MYISGARKHTAVQIIHFYVRALRGMVLNQGSRPRTSIRPYNQTLNIAWFKVCGVSYRTQIQEEILVPAPRPMRD